MELLSGVNALNDVTFTLKDIFYISGFIAAGITAWYKSQADKKEIENKHATFVTVNGLIIDALTKECVKLESRITEEVLHSKNGRNEIRRNLTEMMNQRAQELRQQIDQVKTESIKSYEKLEKKIDELEEKSDTNTKNIINEIHKIK